MSIREKILEFSEKKDIFKTSDVLDALGKTYARQYVSNEINILVKEGKLTKIGKTRGSHYVQTHKKGKLEKRVERKFASSNLEESAVFRALQESTPFLRDASENINSIIFYAFTEMLNNAIEHSLSKFIHVSFVQSGNILEFEVKDAGIGVFRNIMKQRNLKSELESIQDLLKGKTTTAPKAHSGEGIFFTSKVGDIFMLESFGYRLRVDNTLPDVFIEEAHEKKKGTKVTFVINTKSKRHLNDVFKQYQSHADKPDFDKTKIVVKLYTIGTIYISRSQARRILSGLEKFREVVFDFKNVPTIGQAFADEIFRVFRTKHPQIKLTTINAIEPVQYIIDRAT